MEVNLLQITNSPRIKKPKRGRKPCSNPTPQAMRQRAYRLRKQMKQAASQHYVNESKQAIEDIEQIANFSEDICLTDYEQLIAEILLHIKNA
jgi:hypothetical protein